MDSSSKHRLAITSGAFVIGFIGLCALMVFWLTLQPGVSGGDSAEAQFVPYSLGIMHFTGYPLYTIVGYLWSHIVIIGDVAYRMNLLSAVAGALACAAAVQVTYQLSKSWIGGITAAALVGFSALFWDWSTKAGVRSMNVLFAIAIMGLAFAWAQHQTIPRQATDRYWLGLWFVVGLSLAHHRTSILLLPGLAVYILWTKLRVLKEWRALVAAVLMLLPGLATYLYPLWRGMNSPVYQPLPVDSIEHFLDLVLARNLSDMVTAITWQQVPERIGWFIDYLVGQFGIAGVVIAVSGLLLLLIRRPREGVMLTLFLILLTAFTINYRIEGMARLNVVFLLPVNAVVGICGGYLIAVVLQMLRPAAQSMLRTAPTGLVLMVFSTLTLAVVLLLVVPVAGVGLALVYTGTEHPLYAYREELRGMQAKRLTQYGEDLIAPRPVIVGEWEHVAAFWYQQLINHRWQGAEFRYPVVSNLGLYIDQAWQSGREIYVTHAVPGLGDGRQLSMAGALIHILRTPETVLSVQATPSNELFSDGLSLVGYKVYTESLRPGGVLPVSMFWRAIQKLDQDDSISIRLVSLDGKQYAQEDAAHPVLGSFPTTHWQAGTLVGDYYELALPSELPKGEYRLAVVVYQRNDNGASRIVRSQSSKSEITEFGTISIQADQ